MSLTKKTLSLSLSFVSHLSFTDISISFSTLFYHNRVYAGRVMHPKAFFSIIVFKARLTTDFMTAVPTLIPIIHQRELSSIFLLILSHVLCPLSSSLPALSPPFLSFLLPLFMLFNWGHVPPVPPPHNYATVAHNTAVSKIDSQGLKMHLESTIRNKIIAFSSIFSPSPLCVDSVQSILKSLASGSFDMSYGSTTSSCLLCNYLAAKSWIYLVYG